MGALRADISRVKMRYWDAIFRVRLRRMFSVHNGGSSRVRIIGTSRQQSLLQIHSYNNLDDPSGHANHSESYR